jgi:hypothetical protein
MEDAKLPTGLKMQSSRKGSTPKKSISAKAKSARPGHTNTGAKSKSKSERLVCRYCGSEDLAPSFIKRKDRRCRKCFAKRYGLAARTKKPKTNK